MQLNALIGKKTYQKQGFLQDGTRVPLTGVVVAGNIITQIKTQDKEGYNSIQLGVDTKKKANSAILGHARNALSQASKTTTKETTAIKETKNITPKYFKEVRVEDTEGASLGSEILVAEVFESGDIIDVTGVSKGKGWAGGVKRWGFHGGPRTHGQSDRERAPGSIGQTTTPGRVYKGKKMAGRMGSDTVTVKNLEVVDITNDGVLLIKGLVPGRLNGLLIVKKIGQNKKFVPLYKEVVDQPELASEPVVDQALPEAEVIQENVQVGESPVLTADANVQEEAVQVANDAVVSEAEPEPETILAETPEEKKLEEPEQPKTEKENK